MVLTSQDESFFETIGTQDLLNKSLATKEPLGHARGVGVNVPHKMSFPLSEKENVQNKRWKAELKEQRLEVRMREKI